MSFESCCWSESDYCGSRQRWPHNRMGRMDVAGLRGVYCSILVTNCHCLLCQRPVYSVLEYYERSCELRKTCTSRNMGYLPHYCRRRRHVETEVGKPEIASVFLGGAVISCDLNSFKKYTKRFWRSMKTHQELETKEKSIVLILWKS